MTQLTTEYFRVGGEADGLSLPRLQMRDRRAAGHPSVLWIYQRHLERILYHRSEGGSTGAIWKLLNKTGMGATALQVNSAAVDLGHVTQAEHEELVRIFKDSTDGLDPSSLGRIRSCTMLPLATAAAVARTFGRSAESLAFLRAFNQVVPLGWELLEEQEAHTAQGEVDLVLNEQLEELGFEAEEKTFAEELTETFAQFTLNAEDDGKVKAYALQRVPAALQAELDAYVTHRTATFAATRGGGAVQSVSAKADTQSLLRFFGWLDRTDQLPEGATLRLALLGRVDLGSQAQKYVEWLRETQQLRFSSIANYINGLVMITSYVYGNLSPPAETLALECTPLTQLINLRSQAEKAARTQQLFDKRVGGWLTWQEVQECRITAMAALAAAPAPGDPSKHRQLVREAAVISLLSLLPPDRVGIIRKLRFGHTLKRIENGTGWRLDLSKQRDGHKTSRFYGPFAAKLPEELNAVLDAYAAVLALEWGGSHAYLFHPLRGDLDRPLSSSEWTAYIRRLFKKWHGTEIAPKTLRSIFITWLRDSTDCPDVLKSAAHAMKHRPEMQADGTYDANADTRLVKAAYDFNLSFAAQYTAAEVPAVASESTPAAASQDAEHEPMPDEMRRPAGALPAGWTCQEHVTSSSGQRYKRYQGPNGERAQSVKEAWRSAASQEAPPRIAEEAIELGDVIFTLAPPDQQPSEPGTTRWVIKAPWHETMRPGSIIEIPPVEGLLEETLPINLPMDFPHGRRCERVRVLCSIPCASRKTAARPMHVSGARLLPAPAEGGSDSQGDVLPDGTDGTWSIERVLDARMADKSMELLVRWSGTNDEGQPWEDDWIPAWWATPAARRDGKAILKRHRSDGSGEDDPELSSIERTRLENIRRNQEHLRSLDLGGQPSPARPAAAASIPGRIRRPPGRAPKGMQWDAEVGQWEAAEPPEETEAQQVTRVAHASHGPLADNIAETQVEAVAGGWSRAEDGFDTVQGAASNATVLLSTRDASEHNDEMVAQAVAAEMPLSCASPRKLRPKRDGRAPQRLELDHGPASRFKAPRSAAVEASIVPLDDEFSTGGNEVGDKVQAMGAAPTGEQVWFQAVVVGIQKPPAWPPITVKYVATLEGNTTNLVLPQPRTAHLRADQVRRL